MNIFRSLLVKQAKNQFNILNSQVVLQNKVFMTLRPERKDTIPTHRGEFLPFTMNNIWDNPGSKKKKRRIGRGPSSTKGKTAGRGENGQKSRSGGGIHPRFEGGQSSIVRRLPKMGMSIRNRQKPIYVNLSAILYYIQKGTIDPSKTITMLDLYKSGAFKTARFGVKILAKGSDRLNIPLNIECTDASATAIEAIKSKGGSVKCYYKTKLLMREALYPHKFPFKLRDPIPTHRNVKQMERIRERGAEVVYKMPEWKQKEIEEQQREEAEDAAELAKNEEEFQIPVPRYPGVGKDKIRKRKPVIWRTINYGF